MDIFASEKHDEYAVSIVNIISGEHSRWIIEKYGDVHLIYYIRYIAD